MRTILQAPAHVPVRGAHLPGINRATSNLLGVYGRATVLGSLVRLGGAMGIVAGSMLAGSGLSGCSSCNEINLSPISQYEDKDGDGYCVILNDQPVDLSEIEACQPVPDCNDTDAAINPGAAEICNGVDDDCNPATGESELTQTLYVGPNGTAGVGLCQAEISECQNGSYVVTQPQVLPTDETCNGLDDNCDGTTDEGLTQTYYADSDEDTYGDSKAPIQACTLPHGYVTDNTDCDDADAEIHPDAEEVCDGKDNDCNAATDERELTETTYNGPEGTEGVGLCQAEIKQCIDGSYVTVQEEVLPTDEACNGADDNCNGMIDDGVKLTYYADEDGDMYGDAETTARACTQPEGYVSDGTDCDDANATIHPGANESCNGVDDNCDSEIDEEIPDEESYSGTPGTAGVGVCQVEIKQCIDGSYQVTQSEIVPTAEVCDGADNDCDGSTDEGVTQTYYADNDQDNYGNAEVSTQACSAPEGYIADNTDCNDADAAIHPGATEVCNGKDDDCDTVADEGVTQTYYADSDQDGYGDVGTTTEACGAPKGYVSDNTDCDDTDAAVNPGAEEVCNGKDDDCDPTTDEGTLTESSYSGPEGTAGVGVCQVEIKQCIDGSYQVVQNEIVPTDEVCDGADNDCDNATDEGVTQTYYADSDQDTYGNPGTASQACTSPEGYVTDNTDCDDADAAINPGATESCNGVDDNCDGEADEGVQGTYYADNDGDTYGDPEAATQACAQPEGYVSDGTDCDDADAAVHPGTTEVCNGKDDDCDPATDENELTETTYTGSEGTEGVGLCQAEIRQCSDGSWITIQYEVTPTDEVCNKADDDCDGQTDEWWSQTYGGKNFEIARSIQQTTGEGFVLGGYILPYGEAYSDMWLVKTDQMGSMEWSQTYDEEKYDYGYSLQETADSGFVFGGARNNSTYYPDYDSLLIKMDSLGNEEWRETYGEKNPVEYDYHTDETYSVELTTDGGYALAGSTNSYGETYDFWLIKTDSLGNVQWSRTYDWEDSNDYGASAQQTTDEGFILAGYTGLSSYGEADVLLIKVDSSGNQEWERIFGGPSYNDVANFVRQTAEGGFVVAGYTESYGAGGKDFWLIKTDSSGNLEWSQTYGGSKNDVAYSVQPTEDGYVLAGYTNSYGSGGSDFWLVGTDSLGNMQWSETYGGKSDDVAYSMTPTSDEGYALAGYTYSYGSGYTDFWLVKACDPLEE